MTPRYGGGRRPTYDAQARARIAAEAGRRRPPSSTAPPLWSLSTLRWALRSAPDGLPKGSTCTIREVLRDAGATYQRTRTW